MGVADLLSLQGNIKRDADGYKDEFMLQYRHYQAMVDIFSLKPSKESKEFGDLAMFLAQVSKCYPKETVDFPLQLAKLMEDHYEKMDPALRRSVVQALVILRNKGQLDSITLLPLMFTLFKCQDKMLREQVFKHIVTDIKVANEKARNEKLNRKLQSFLYNVLKSDNEMAAKKALAVLTDLWRRHVWRDARTVNVIASAAENKSSRIMLAVIKFFLGQDSAGDDSDNESDGEEENSVAQPTKQDVYKAHHKGTNSSKKKKIAKLKRVMNTVRKAQRKHDVHHESFAALHLLHDPQAFAEKLFERLKKERYETKIAMLTVISRVIGVHKLLLLNFYPLLQKYIKPSQQDVTVILAALIQACHPLVPPDTLQPVVRQLVDQFVHDRARPEVMTIGLKTVREISLRTPLVMHEELLHDLAMYKKFRDKEVSTAARGLINLFQELNPGMLAKKDRGRGADLTATPAAYGALDVKDRLEGAELLQEALINGDLSDDEDGEDEEGEGWQTDSGGESEGEEKEEGEGSEDEGEEGGSDGEGEEAEGGEKAKGAKADAEPGAISDDEEGVEEDDEDDGEDEDDDEDQEDEEDVEEEVSDDDEGDHEANGRARKKKAAKDKAEKKLQPTEDSISHLKKKLAEAKAKASATTAALPNIEMDGFLTDADFERIKGLRHKQMIDKAMAKHGLKSAGRQKRLRETAEQEAEEAMELDSRRKNITEHKLDPDSLVGRHKRRKDKEERMQSVLAGREGREFGAASKVKRQKTGGLSEREKQRRKQLPLAARMKQIGKRKSQTKFKRNNDKNFKGRVRG